MKNLNLAKKFYDLHQEGCLVLPNAWDSASAVLMQAAGAVALATTSSGVSWSLGVPDGEQLNAEDMLSAMSKLVSAVSIPVSLDLEGGYADTPEGVADIVEFAMHIGAVGVNIEDCLHGSQTGLRDIHAHCEYLAAIRTRMNQHDMVFTINARTDMYLREIGTLEERENATIQRAIAYKEAGADCLFVPGIVDIDLITSLVRRSPLPLNVMLVPSLSPSIDALASAGVRRITVGHAIAGLAYSAMYKAAQNLLNGSYDALEADMSYMDFQNIMSAT